MGTPVLRSSSNGYYYGLKTVGLTLPGLPSTKQGEDDDEGRGTCPVSMVHQTAGLIESPRSPIAQTRKKNKEEVIQNRVETLECHASITLETVGSNLPDLPQTNPEPEREHSHSNQVQLYIHRCYACPSTSIHTAAMRVVLETAG